MILPLATIASDVKNSDGVTICKIFVQELDYSLYESYSIRMGSMFFQQLSLFINKVSS